MASYSVNALTDDCYQGTTVLINKLNINNQGDLDAVESAIVPAKAALWEENPLMVSFDFAHYCAIHKYLFEDLYECAGKIRTVDISKKGTPFCPAVQIESTAQAVFSRLQAQNSLRGLNKTAFTAYKRASPFPGGKRSHAACVFVTINTLRRIRIGFYLH